VGVPQRKQCLETPTPSRKGEGKRLPHRSTEKHTLYGSRLGGRDDDNLPMPSIDRHYRQPVAWGERDMMGIASLHPSYELLYWAGTTR
jgi:hypothetical protein